VQVAIPAFRVVGLGPVHVGLVPEGGVIVQVIVPDGVIVALPLTVTLTVKLEPGCGFCGVVEKLNVGVALLTLIVVGDPVADEK
jgi:hypothetical protein